MATSYQTTGAGLNRSTDAGAESTRAALPSMASLPSHSSAHHQHGDSAAAAEARQRYLDSLVPPSPEEFERISHVQEEREEEERQRHRHQHHGHEASGDHGSRRHQGVGEGHESSTPVSPDTPPESAVSDNTQRHTSSLHGIFHSRHGSNSSGHGGAASIFHRHQNHSSKAADHGSGTEANHNHGRRQAAATVIQRHYRGYRTRRELAGFGLDASTRWLHAVREAQWREATRPRSRAEISSRLSCDGGGGSGRPSLETASPQKEVRDDGSTLTPAGRPSYESTASGRRPRSAQAMHNWKKAALIARRAGGDRDEAVSSDSSETSSSSSSSSSDESFIRRRRKEKKMTEEQREEARRKRQESKERRRKEARIMDLQYFLEMVDVKHRYGANLRVYHEEWQRSDTRENFFYWLDYGEGRRIDIAACPRDRLERERVRYLSREERAYYLVTVDDQGRLCWAKNGVPIDTTEKYRDSIHGIVPKDDPTPPYHWSDDDGTAGAPTAASAATAATAGSPNRSSSSLESEREADRAAKYATPAFDDAPNLVKKIHAVSVSTIINKLLRKSVRKNTWIFVADTSFRLYVGLKDSGAFQHSSFLQGGRIAAAGLVRIKQGRLVALSPLSGHYRPPASNFRAFVRSLKEAGVDMSHVRLSKSYVVLVGLEAYVTTRRRTRRALERLRHGVQHVIHPETADAHKGSDVHQSASAQPEGHVLEQPKQDAHNANTAVVGADSLHRDHVVEQSRDQGHPQLPHDHGSHIAEKAAGAG